MRTCHTCNGKRWIHNPDIADGPRWQHCSTCAGKGSIGTIAAATSSSGCLITLTGLISLITAIATALT